MRKWFSKKKSATVQNCKCPCCGFYTIAQENGVPFHGDICPVCFWEIDLLGGPDEPSDANHGLTLFQAQQNYQNFGACDKKSLKFVRSPKPEELSGIDD